jgi:hypothetical protein
MLVLLDDRARDPATAGLSAVVAGAEKAGLTACVAGVAACRDIGRWRADMRGIM